MTRQHVIDYHAHEAARYLKIAQNWLGSALAEQRRDAYREAPNGVRQRQFEEAALLATFTARGHLEMAAALTGAATDLDVAA